MEFSFGIYFLSIYNRSDPKTTKMIAIFRQQIFFFNYNQFKSDNYRVELGK